MPLPTRLLERGVRDMVRISDARMSGTAYGTVVLHVAPESAAGGPLGLVRDGDPIVLDVAERRLDIDVPRTELDARVPSAAAAASYASPARGWERLYIDHVLQAPLGADLDFLVGGSGSARLPRVALTASTAPPQAATVRRGHPTGRSRVGGHRRGSATVAVSEGCGPGGQGGLPRPDGHPVHVGPDRRPCGSHNRCDGAHRPSMTNRSVPHRADRPGMNAPYSSALGIRGIPPRRSHQPARPLTSEPHAGFRAAAGLPVGGSPPPHGHRDGRRARDRARQRVPGDRARRRPARARRRPRGRDRPGRHDVPPDGHRLRRRR